MRILVTGATGFIGLEVARQLSEAGMGPRLLVRRPWRGALLSRLDADIMAADLTRPSSLKRAVEDVDAVIHLGARATFESYRRLHPSIVEGTRSLALAAAEAGVRRFVYGSSMLVYADRNTVIGPDTPPDPQLDYGRAKLKAEEALDEVSAEHGMSRLSIRLPHVYGARDLFFTQLARGQGRFIMPGRGNNTFSHLYVADAARVLIAAAQNRIEGALPVADQQPTAWTDFFAVLADCYPRARVLPVPAGLARTGAALLQPLLQWRRQPSLVTPGTVIGWNLNLAIDPTCLWPKLDLEPCHPTIATGIPATLDELVAYRWIHPVHDGVGW
jgi:nucleoside-diphosphate-sugar epimerase